MDSLPGDILLLIAGGNDKMIQDLAELYPEKVCSIVREIYCGRAINLCSSWVADHRPVSHFSGLVKFTTHNPVSRGLPKSLTYINAAYDVYTDFADLPNLRTLIIPRNNVVTTGPLIVEILECRNLTQSAINCLPRLKSIKFADCADREHSVNFTKTQLEYYDQDPRDDIHITLPSTVTSIKMPRSNYPFVDSDFSQNIQYPAETQLKRLHVWSFDSEPPEGLEYWKTKTETVDIPNGYIRAESFEACFDMERDILKKRSDFQLKTINIKPGEDGYIGVNDFIGVIRARSLLLEMKSVNLVNPGQLFDHLTSMSVKSWPNVFPPNLTSLKVRTANMQKECDPLPASLTHLNIRIVPGKFDRAYLPNLQKCSIQYAASLAVITEYLRAPKLRDMCIWGVDKLGRPNWDHLVSLHTLRIRTVSEEGICPILRYVPQQIVEFSSDCCLLVPQPPGLRVLGRGVLVEEE